MAIDAGVLDDEVVSSPQDRRPNGELSENVRLAMVGVEDEK
jgi:hypothetical protein